MAAAALFWLGEESALGQCIWSHKAKFTSENPQTHGAFGTAIALADTTAVVGATGDRENGILAGAAFVIERTSTGWVETAKLVAPDGKADDYFGYNVAVRGDVVAVSAITKDVCPTCRNGSVYLYERSGTDWVYVQKLIASDATNDELFGFATALCGDELFVSAPYKSATSPDDGTIYTFVRTQDGWTETGTVPLAPQWTTFLGDSLAVDGDWLAAGAPGYGPQWGAVEMYERSPTGWVHRQTVFSPTGTTPWEYFGDAVALSGDRMLVGAPLHNGNGVFDSGAAFAFRRDDVDGWVATSVLLPPEMGFRYQFGYTVALDGARALVTNQQVAGGCFACGAAYFYGLIGGAWIQERKALSNGFGADHFGAASALAGDHALVGARREWLGGLAWGHVYHYEAGGSPASHYGTACLGSGGFAPELELVGCPVEGLTVEFDVTNGLGGRPALILLGLERAGGSSPLCEAQVGSVFARLSVTLTGAGPGQGAGRVTYALPASTPRGTRVTAQVMVRDEGVPGDVAASDALEFFVQ